MDIQQKMEVWEFDHSQTFPTWLAKFSLDNLITNVIVLEYINRTPTTSYINKALIIYESKDRK
jgi:hypothetical protein